MTNTYCSEQEIERMVFLRQRGESLGFIAIKLDRSKSFVHKYINLCELGYEASEIISKTNKSLSRRGRKRYILSSDWHDRLQASCGKRKWSLACFERRMYIKGLNEGLPSFGCLYRMVKERTLSPAVLKRPKKRGRKVNGNPTISRVNASTIHDRDAKYEEIHLRRHQGHYEGDTVVGKGVKSKVVTLADRTTRFLHILKTDNMTAMATNAALVKWVTKNQGPEPLTITFDRGTEFSKLQEFTKKTGIEHYYADAGTPSQRGTNENCNRLIREFIARDTDFRETSQEWLNEVAGALNDMPRKMLGYRTAREAMNLLVNRSR